MALKDAADSIANEKKNAASTDKLRELLDRAEPMIEQLHQLYQMYFSGAEKRAPIVQRDQFNALMNTLQALDKPTQALRFRFETLRSRVSSYRQLWEKGLKKLETGKRR